MKTQRAFLSILIFLMTFSLTGFSQVPVKPRAQLSFGAKAGINIATAIIDGTTANVNAKSTLGFHLGLIMDAPVSTNFSIISELLYSTKGFETSEEESFNYPGIGNFTVKVEEKEELKYLDVVVMATYKSNGLQISAGPYLGILTGAKYTGRAVFTMNGMQQVETESNSSTEGLSSEDFGLALGLGYQFSNGLGLSGRYSHGLSNILDFEEETTVTNSVISFSLFYIFPHN